MRDLDPRALVLRIAVALEGRDTTEARVRQLYAIGNRAMGADELKDHHARLREAREKRIAAAVALEDALVDARRFGDQPPATDDDVDQAADDATKALLLRGLLERARAELERVKRERDDLAGECNRVRDALQAAGAADGVLLSNAVTLLATRAREAEGERDRLASLASALLAEYEVVTHDEEDGRPLSWEERFAWLRQELGAISEGESIMARESREARTERDALRAAVHEVECQADTMHVAVERALATVNGIANAKRFDREAFETDADFIDWAQSRCRHEAANLTAALSPAQGEAKPDTRDARIAELRGLLLEFIKAEGVMAGDCDGVYPDVFDAIEKTIAALRDPSHPCKLCGGVDWRIRATPGGEFDEVFERCDHQPIDDDDAPEVSP